MHTYGLTSPASHRPCCTTQSATSFMGRAGCECRPLFRAVPFHCHAATCRNITPSLLRGVGRGKFDFKSRSPTRSMTAGSSQSYQQSQLWTLWRALAQITCWPAVWMNSGLSLCIECPTDGSGPSAWSATVARNGQSLAKVRQWHTR